MKSERIYDQKPNYSSPDIFFELNKSQAKTYGTELYKKLKLTKTEIKSLKKYRHSSDKINKAVRENKDSKDIYNISNVIQRAVVDKNIVVYRESHINFLKTNGTTIEKVKVGDLLIDDGFMSTFLYRPKMVFIVVQLSRQKSKTFIMN